MKGIFEENLYSQYFRLFPTITPKVIKVNARQYPVTVHFEKKTPDNYMAAAFRKVYSANISHLLLDLSDP